MGRMMVLASILGMIFSSTGIWLSYVLDMPTGAIIILVAGSCYLLSAIFSQWWQQAKARKTSA
jgi:zinc transport system permease protein